MNQSSNTRGWREKPAYIELLGYFSKPKQINYVRAFKSFGMALSFTALNPRQINKALDQYIEEGDIVPCSVIETLVATLSGAELRRLARERGLPVSGAKRELVERLYSNEPNFFEEMVSQFEVYICSDAAQKIVEDYWSEKNQRTENIKVECYRRLLDGDVSSAYKMVLEHYLYYPTYGEYFTPMSDHSIAEMGTLIRAAPPVLKSVNEDLLRHLRASACMSMIWGNEFPEAWIPENLDMGGLSTIESVNQLKSCARIRNQINQYQGVQDVLLKLKFHDNDFHSCDLCRHFTDKVFPIDEVPDYPLEGCRSFRGCGLWFESVYIGESAQNLDVILEEDGSEYLNNESDIVERLGILKGLFESELISAQEYEAKKAEIISTL